MHDRLRQRIEDELAEMEALGRGAGRGYREGGTIGQRHHPPRGSGG